MKKLSLVLLAVVCYFSALSQEKGSFEFGFNVGYNAATVTSGTNTNSSYRSGFNAGIIGDYFFSDRWSIKTKLTYDQKGWADGFIRDTDSGQEFKTNFNIDYLSIPLMANWHFGRKRNWYLHFGPYAGILLSSKDSRFSNDLKPYTHNTDIGLGYGIGVKLPVANRVKIILELDGQEGFTDVFKQNDVDQSFKNSRSGFNAGLLFQLK